MHDVLPNSGAQDGANGPGALLPDALAALDRIYRERVQAGAMAGISYAIAHGGRIVHRSTIGMADIEQQRPITDGTVFRLASMTKPVTAVALMMLFEEGKFSLDDRIADYLPEFADTAVLQNPMSMDVATDPAQCPITIRHILQHTAGLGLGLGLGLIGEALLLQAGPYEPGEDLATQMHKIAAVPLSYQPGTVWSYSLSPDVQARLVEVLSGTDFATFLDTRMFRPLGMNDTTFAPSPEMTERLAKIYWSDGERLVPWGENSKPPVPPIIPNWPQPFLTLHDPSIAHVRGSFGLSSTVGDYMRFVLMLLGGGSLDGVRILDPKTVKLMAIDTLGETPMMMWPVQGLGFGLGLAVLRDPAAAGYAGTPGMFHWDGALGTVMWVDPERDLAVVGMAQHLLIPELTPDALGAELRNHVYAALVD